MTTPVQALRRPWPATRKCSWWPWDAGWPAGRRFAGRRRAAGPDDRYPL